MNTKFLSKLAETVREYVTFGPGNLEEVLKDTVLPIQADGRRFTLKVIKSDKTNEIDRIGLETEHVAIEDANRSQYVHVNIQISLRKIVPMPQTEIADVARVNAAENIQRFWRDLLGVKELRALSANRLQDARSLKPHEYAPAWREEVPGWKPVHIAQAAIYHVGDVHVFIRAAARYAADGVSVHPSTISNRVH